MFKTHLYQRLQKISGALIPTTMAAVVLSNSPQISVSNRSVDPAANRSSLETSVTFSLGAAAQAQIALRPDWSDLEQEILAEQNPQSYIPILERYLANMTEDGYVIHGCGQNCVLTTREGRSAVREAIAFLERQPAVVPLAESGAASRAAKSHARDQRGGATGHVSSDGTPFWERLSQFGMRNVGMGENIAYGARSAEQVVMNLIVDDGVPDRGHRTNMFAPNWAVAGVGCGDHATYRTVCVVDYATQ